MELLPRPQLSPLPILGFPAGAGQRSRGVLREPAQFGRPVGDLLRNRESLRKRRIVGSMPCALASGGAVDQLLTSSMREVVSHHEQDLSGIDGLLEGLEPRVRTTSPRGSRQAPKTAPITVLISTVTSCSVTPSGGSDNVDADRKPAAPRVRTRALRRDAVGLLQVVARAADPGHPSLGEEVHVTILDPREQQIVGGLDGAARSGNRK